MITKLPLEGSMVDKKMRASTITGALIGDYVGSRFEFNNIKSKEFEFFHPDCKFTDDSIITIAVYSAFNNYINNTKNYIGDLLVSEIVRICRLKPYAGYGGMFRKWLFGNNHEPYNSYGNGSAMRVSPVAYFFDNINDVIKYSRESAMITHNHPEGVKGAECVAVLCHMALCGKLKDDIESKANEYYDTDFTVDSIRDTYEFSETCRNTVPQAIVAFLDSNSYEDAIRNAISIGGDSDTLACITGSIAGAYYGVPYEMEEYIKNELRTCDNLNLYNIIEELF